jgi:hypothetical protein
MKILKQQKPEKRLGSPSSMLYRSNAEKKAHLVGFLVGADPGK